MINPLSNKNDSILSSIDKQIDKLLLLHKKQLENLLLNKNDGDFTLKIHDYTDALKNRAISLLENYYDLTNATINVKGLIYHKIEKDEISFIKNHILTRTKEFDNISNNFISKNN